MTTLIADIGGTNTRCALVGPDGPVNCRRYANSDFSDPAALLRSYLDALATAPDGIDATLAIAAPVSDDRLQMTNLDWSTSLVELREQLGARELQVLNDFEALAWALPFLSADDLLQIGPGEPEPRAPRAVLGPGTGLGVGSLVPAGDGWVAIPGEGGHVSLAACSAAEEQLIRKARERFGHCSAERLLSGSGLTLIHALLHEGDALTPEQLGERISAGDPQAVASFGMFCELLATVAADLALTLGAFGGIYLGGGILPRHADAFAASNFRARFTDKGRYANYLAKIPTCLITAEEPTLRGLWAFTRQSA